MITFACVLVKGYVGYSPDYVKKLYSMVRNYYEGTYIFYVLTDDPGQFDINGAGGVNPIAIDSPPFDYPWWAKVELFKPGRFHGRVCYLDLDTLVVRNLNVVTDYPTPMALVPHEGGFKGKNGKKVVKRYNSSVMVWDAGHADNLYTDFNPTVRERLWGDQDWIGERMPYERKMPLEWFPRLSGFDAPSGNVPPDARIVLCKKPKNKEAAQKWSWFHQAWQ